MMISPKVFDKELMDVLHVAYDTQHETLEEVSKQLCECIMNKGRIHVFGTGHSVGFGIDISNRKGSYLPINIMKMSDFVTKKVVSFEDFSNKDDIFERRSGVASRFLELYDVQPQDCFIIISNSGINGIVIDLAQLAEERGHKVIVVTSMKHTTSEASRHPSGKKLYEFGDYVIDNCGPIGDALLETGKLEKVCSISSIVGNCIAQAIQARTCQLLDEKGFTL